MERLRKFSKEVCNRSKPKGENGNFKPSKPKGENEDLNLSKSKEDNAGSSFVTSFKEEKFSFTWRIENINRCTLKSQEFLESPVFSTRFCGEEKWTLRIYPRRGKCPGGVELMEHLDSRSCEKVGLFLRRISTNAVMSTFKYSFYCERVKGYGDRDSKEVIRFPNKFQEDKIVYTEFYMEDGLYVYGTNDLYCPHDFQGAETLIVRCDIYVINVFNTGVNNGYAGISKSCALFRDLKEMYESGKFSDITLQARDVNFPAHKNILASRSKVFDAMFQHDMKETQTGVIQVEDIEPAVLSILLQYIYTGIVDDFHIEKAIALYSAADKYFVEELKNWCVNIMLENMTVENVCQIAILAELHPDPKLKEATLNLFRKYTSDIFIRKEWHDLVGDTQHHGLVSEILRTVSKDFITNCERN